MELTREGPNYTLIRANSGACVLFSYSIPVAVIDETGRQFRTSKFYSRVTNSHVAKFLGGKNGDSGEAQAVNQEVIDAYVKNLS